MSTLHILFYGRPEIVCKLSSFYHYMDFRVKAAHTIGCTYNIIFGNRCAEYTRLAKFLLHAFGHIKDPAFFSVCHILSPDKGIRIMAEFRFQCFINCIDQESLLSFFLMSTFFVFLRLIRFGHHKIVNAFRIRFRGSQRLAVGSR